MCKYCIFTLDWISRISYVHIGQYYYYYYYYYYTTTTSQT